MAGSSAARLIHISVPRRAPTRLSGTITALPAPHHRWWGLSERPPPLSPSSPLSAAHCLSGWLSLSLSTSLSFFMLRLFLSLPPPSVSTAVLLLPRFFPSLPLCQLQIQQFNLNPLHLSPRRSVASMVTVTRQQSRCDSASAARPPTAGRCTEGTRGVLM